MNPNYIMKQIKRNTRVIILSLYVKLSPNCPSTDFYQHWSRIVKQTVFQRIWTWIGNWVKLLI